MTLIAQRGDRAQPLSLRSSKQAIHDLTLDQVAKERFFIGKAQCGKALRVARRPIPSRTTCSSSLDVCCADDQGEPGQSRGLKMVVLDDRFETIARTAVIEFDFRQTGRVGRDRVFPRSALKLQALINKKELGVRVDEAMDQPRAGDPIHFDVFTSYPFHSASEFSASGMLVREPLRTNDCLVDNHSRDRLSVLFLLRRVNAVGLRVDGKTGDRMPD